MLEILQKYILTMKPKSKSTSAFEYDFLVSFYDKIELKHMSAKFQHANALCAELLFSTKH